MEGILGRFQQIRLRIRTPTATFNFKLCSETEQIIKTCQHSVFIHFLTDKISEKASEASRLTSSVSFTRRICSRRSWRSLNVDCAVMEYTRANPCPFFMYRSLMAVNCSYRDDARGQRPSGTWTNSSRGFKPVWLTVPAVSRISSMHCCPSTSTCCWSKVRLLKSGRRRM